jgi:hypothetical protein
MAGFLLTTLHEALYFTCAGGCPTFKKQRGEVTHGIAHTMVGVIREPSPTNKGRCPDVGRTRRTCVTEAQDRLPSGIGPLASPYLLTILPTKLYRQTWSSSNTALPVTLVRPFSVKSDEKKIKNHKITLF